MRKTSPSTMSSRSANSSGTYLPFSNALVPPDASGDPSRSLFRNSPGWGTVLTERQNAETIFKEEINRLRQKWSRTQQREAVGLGQTPDANGYPSTRKVPDHLIRADSDSSESLIEPGCLFLVMRRLPYIIKYSRYPNLDKRSRPAPTAREEFDKDGETDRDEEGRISTDTADANRSHIVDETVTWEDYQPESRPPGTENVVTSSVERGRWKLINSTSSVDYMEIFKNLVSSSCTILLVGDPVVDLSNLSLDKDVQKRLRDRLTDFLRTLNIIPVWSSESARRERYSEDLLHPLFHYRTPPIGTGFSYLDWPGFTEANKAFADTLKNYCEVGDWFLIFNYHLMLLSQMLRDIGKCEKSLIYFYLPTVFPSSEMYRILPERQELLTGVLHSDIVGFHSHIYRGHFMTAVTRILGVECTAHTVEPCVESGGMGTRVTLSPMGINCEPWQEIVKGLDLHDLRQRFKDKKIILGVDNLDYSKGLPQKMVAFRKFLTTYPRWATRVVFIQLCLVGRKTIIDTTPSASHRLSALDRKDILTQVFQVAGHINSAFGTIDHLPVHFLVGQFSIKELAPVYALADIGLMTSLRESVSSSLYHFILCQANTNKGVCIVSEFSSSAQLLSGAALQVNPWDINQFAETIREALTMPEDERRAGHELAYSLVTRWDAKAWGKQILSDFREAAMDLGDDRVDVPPPLNIPKAVEDLCSAKHVIVVSGMRETLLKTPGLMLDQEIVQSNYDLAKMESLHEINSNLQSPATPVLTPQGTAKTPSCSASANVSPLPITLLTNSSSNSDVATLCSLPDVSVIIASSASVAVLRRVLADAPGLWALAENGHFISFPGSPDFEPFPPAALSSSYSIHQNNINSGSTGPIGGVEINENEVSLFPEQEAEDEETDFQQCLDKVGDLVDYFVKRTPGSFKRKTETSISWHYGTADTRFAAQQGKDLLFYLYAGPLLNNKRLELCVGKASVEVRSCKVTKCIGVEWIVKQICEAKDLKPSDISIVCIGNYLPRDEDLYTLAQKLTASQPSNKRGRGLDSGSPSCKPMFAEARMSSFGLSESREESSPAIQPNQRPSVTQLPHNGDELPSAEFGEQSVRNSPTRCITCTVGIRFSKSAYRLETKSQIATLFRGIAETKAKRNDMTQRLPNIVPPLPEIVTLPPTSPKFANTSLAPSVDIAMSLSSPRVLSSANYYNYYPPYGVSVPHVRNSDPFLSLHSRHGGNDPPHRSLTARNVSLSKSNSLDSPDSLRERSHLQFIKNHPSFMKNSQSAESPLMTPVASGSDVEDDTDNDEEEIFLPSALNIPNSIPFTHARKGVWSASWREAQEHQLRNMASPNFVIPQETDYLKQPSTDLRFPENDLSKNLNNTPTEKSQEHNSNSRSPANFETPMSIPSTDVYAKFL